LNQNEALASFVLNFDIKTLEESKLVERLNNGDDIIKTVIEELPRYNKGYDIIQGIKVENTRLSQRRNSEIRFFCKESSVKVL
jgi:GH24 family phage-related lysozyme (muramidase)